MKECLCGTRNPVAEGICAENLLLQIIRNIFRPLVSRIFTKKAAPEWAAFLLYGRVVQRLAYCGGGFLFRTVGFIPNMRGAGLLGR